ncbi:hypothetical protein GWI72_04570 [Microvirga tunisiensis]|uniref:Uncharacterized protein n=2 Tax=Pannonibacter tanglangensis TaxID=2750084 RepID=A0ABW9ZLJ1_9HYPH|nr:MULTISPECIES: hypothetical protein [unclassified Pannonibacter]NBN63899.1 hypothetical protein [Pannonibacter sp. XCT-34]NBN77538.1 hypothetical protein [Pannonibacter sp. XCT-53]
MGPVYKLCGSLLVLLASLQTASASDQSYWRHETVKGFEKYYTSTRDGSHFIIWCNPARKLAGTVLDIDIKGQSAPARKTIQIVLDRSAIDVPADENGFVRADCPACSDRSEMLWKKLSSSTNLAVRFNDETVSRFSTRGAREVLKGSPCAPARSS